MADEAVRAWIRERASQPIWAEDRLGQPVSEPEIRAAIETDGRWAGRREWRISTVTRLSIERLLEDGAECFEASAECGTHMVTRSSSLDSALAFLKVHAALLQEEFYVLGWPR
jgi:hypothetical protein